MESLETPFPAVCGEHLQRKGKVSEGIVTLSNYRLLIHSPSTTLSIPVGLIEQVETRDIFFLHIHCKDGRSVRLTFERNESCQDWCRVLSSTISGPRALQDIFAFHFYEACQEESPDDLHGVFTLNSNSLPCADYLTNLQSEMERMGFDLEGAWRISPVNKNYAICSTYPEHLLVPFCITDAVLEKVAHFRSSGRIPAVVWRHKGNGAVLARCSQPEVGLLGWRSNEDESLIKAIADACAWNTPLEPSPGGERQKSSSESSTSTDELVNGYATLKDANISAQKVQIVDARSYATAVANRARGGGCECQEYYPNCEVTFMNLANIHSIRKSFISLRSVCSLPPDHGSWWSQLENSRWLHHIAGLLKAAHSVAQFLNVDRTPVVVHCSDGWDRTPQIISLAELILDPYYRTLEGFQVLVEREWLEYGHKFGDRCGSGFGAEDGNERCPVFLQWLDCVHQLMHQFPTTFQFNLVHLEKLLEHVYSNLFGTFLFNSARERKEQQCPEKTYSVWAYVRAQTYLFLNHLYVPDNTVLNPSCNVRDMVFWSAVYLSSQNDKYKSQVDINPPLPGLASDLTLDSKVVCIGHGSRQGGQGPDEEEQEEKESPGNQEVVMNGVGHRQSSQTDDEEEEEEEAGGRNAESEKMSTNTLVPGSAVINQVDNSHCVVCMNRKIVECHNHGVSRPPSSGFPATPCEEKLLPAGGNLSREVTELLRRIHLEPEGNHPHDVIQRRLRDIIASHQMELAVLRRDLYMTRLALCQQVCHRCHRHGPEAIAQEGLSGGEEGEGKVGEGENRGGIDSAATSEASWEAVDEKDAGPLTLWVPDHAAPQCQDCGMDFWLGRRKHHCRGCGRVCCSECSSNMMPLPREQLYDPVRVCGSCYRYFTELSLQNHSMRNGSSLSESLGE